MPLLQYISFGIDKAIEMLMDSGTSKVEVMLYLENFKKILKEPEKEIVDGDFKEIEIKGIEDRRIDRMSISEQVKELREIAMNWNPNVPINPVSVVLNKAADTIESLSAKLQAANMERSADCSGWISCKERLPEEDVNVLVQVSGTYRNITFEDAFELATYIKGEGWTLESYPDIYNPNIIAWQPLPEPYHEP